MKKFLSFLAVFLIVGMASQASAVTITNAGFESNTFDGWTVSGTANVVTSSAADDSTNYLPTYGNYFAELTGTTSISQGLSWSAGETITFKWAFLAFDEENDYAYYELAGDRTILANVIGTDHDVLHVTPFGDSDWRSIDITFVADGVGDLIFGVANIETAEFLNSKLLIDIEAAPVPEPATMLLFGLGLLGLAGAGRKKA